MTVILCDRREPTGKDQMCDSNHDDVAWIEDSGGDKETGYAGRSSRRGNTLCLGFSWE